MNSNDWKVKAAIALMGLVIIFVVALFLANKQYKESLEVQMDNLTYAICNYIDSNLKAVNDTIESFNFVEDVVPEKRNQVEIYLAEWVENTNDLISLFYFDFNNVSYSYSINDEFDNPNDVLKYIDKVKTSDRNYSYVDTDKKVIYIGKKIYNNFNNNGVLIAVYDYSKILHKIDLLGLELNGINVFLYDNFNYIIYSNSDFAELNQSIEDAKIITGLGNEQETNLVKRLLLDLSDFIKRMFNKSNSDYIISEKVSEYEILKVKINCEVNDASYHFQNRLVIFIGLFCVFIVIIAICSLFLNTKFERIKIYILSIITFIILLTSYFVCEIIFMDKVIERAVLNEAYFVSEVIETQSENIKSKTALMTDIFRNIAKTKNLDSEELFNKYNEIVYIVKYGIKNIDGIMLINDDKNIYSYPNEKNNLIKLYELYKNNGDELYYYNDKIIMFYTLNSGTNTLCFECTPVNYNDICNVETYISSYEFENDNEENGMNSQIENLIQSTGLKTINNKAKIVRKYSLTQIKNYIFIYNSGNEIESVYVTNNKNRFNILMKIYLICLIATILFTSLFYLAANRINKKTNNLDKNTKNDSVMLDRLLKKINDDINQINKSYDGGDTLVDLDYLDDDKI